MIGTDSVYYTHNVDVLLEIKDNLDIVPLREKLSKLSNRFASAGLKFYCLKETKVNLSGEELVRKSEDKVLIETLPAGSLGLPTLAGPRYEVKHKTGSIDILHPGVLLLTKMKRWHHNRESTRPKTMRKNLSDRRDLDYLVAWLAEHNMTIEFEEYHGKTQDGLLPFVRCYRDALCDNKELLKNLKNAMKTKDWDLLTVTSS